MPKGTNLEDRLAASTYPTVAWNNIDKIYDDQHRKAARDSDGSSGRSRADRAASRRAQSRRLRQGLRISHGFLVAVVSDACSKIKTNITCSFTNSVPLTRGH